MDVEGFSSSDYDSSFVNNFRLKTDVFFDTWGNDDPSGSLDINFPSCSIFHRTSKSDKN